MLFIEILHLQVKAECLLFATGTWYYFPLLTGLRNCYFLIRKETQWFIFSFLFRKSSQRNWVFDKQQYLKVSERQSMKCLTVFFPLKQEWRTCQSGSMARVASVSHSEEWYLTSGQTKACGRNGRGKHTAWVVMSTAAKTIKLFSRKLHRLLLKLL